MKYKSYEELKEELGNKFERYMYDINLELLKKIDEAIEYINNLKPLSIVETSIKEELKSAYNPKKSSIKGTDDYFDTVCHLEDFEVGIWNVKDILQGSDKE